MLAGYPPFYDDNPLGIYQKIMDGYYEFPPHVEPKARDLVKSFLCADRSLRLGYPRVRQNQPLHILISLSFRVDPKKSKATSGSEALTSKWSWKDECRLHGYPRSATWSTLSTSTATPSLLSRTPCLLRSNKSTSSISDMLSPFISPCRCQSNFLNSKRFLLKLTTN
jgi:serine/threonine protein kinase